MEPDAAAADGEEAGGEEDGAGGVETGISAGRAASGITTSSRR